MKHFFSEFRKRKNVPLSSLFSVYGISLKVIYVIKQNSKEMRNGMLNN
jgi:hypothetical protein